MLTSPDAQMLPLEVLQSVIGSLRLRCGDPVARLTEALDAYALDKTFMIEDFLFPLQKGGPVVTGWGPRRQKGNRPKAATAFEAESSAMPGDCGFGHVHTRKAQMLNRPDAQML